MNISLPSLPAGFAACFILVATIFSPGPAGAETLKVTVSGLDGAAGNLQVMIWSQAAGFPMQPEKALARKTVAVSAPRMDVLFAGLPKGVYAVAAFHDLNANGKLDRSLLGWPTEPVGASNGASGVMGPPRFADASFELRRSPLTIEIRLK